MASLYLPHHAGYVKRGLHVLKDNAHTPSFWQPSDLPLLSTRHSVVHLHHCIHAASDAQRFRRCPGPTSWFDCLLSVVVFQYCFYAHLLWMLGVTVLSLPSPSNVTAGPQSRGCHTIVSLSSTTWWSSWAFPFSRFKTTVHGFLKHLTFYMYFVFLTCAFVFNISRLFFLFSSAGAAVENNYIIKLISYQFPIGLTCNTNSSRV